MVFEVTQDFLDELKKFFDDFNLLWDEGFKKKYGYAPQNAQEFWAALKKSRKPHIHNEGITNFSIDELKSKYSKELSKVDSYEKAVWVGIKLMGDHYLDGFSSRSSCAHMATLVGFGTNYMDFYCSSSDYYRMEQIRLAEENLLKF